MEIEKKDIKPKTKKINLGENIDQVEMKRFVKKILVEIKKDEKEVENAKQKKKEDEKEKKRKEKIQKSKAKFEFTKDDLIHFFSYNFDEFIGGNKIEEPDSDEYDIDYYAYDNKVKFFEIQKRLMTVMNEEYLKLKVEEEKLKVEEDQKKKDAPKKQK